MKNLIKLGLIVLGASALTLTMASATCGSGKDAPKAMKCHAGKCGDGMKKDMKKDMNKTAEKKEPKGKCGQGKCGSK